MNLIGRSIKNHSSVAIAAVIVLVYCAASRAADDEAFRYYIIDSKRTSIQLVDSELMISGRFSKAAEPTARMFGSTSDVFGVIRTDHGALLLLHPKDSDSKNNAQQMKLEGHYLTVDYSVSPPAIKFTEKPEKDSYWQLPEIGGHFALHHTPKAGPISNTNESGRTVYLSITPESESFKHASNTGHWEYRRLFLSDKHTDDFNVQRINPKEKNDDGK